MKTKKTVLNATVTEEGIYQFLSKNGLTEELEFAQQRFYNVREIGKKIPEKTFTCELLKCSDYEAVVLAIREEMDTVYYLNQAISLVEKDKFTIPELLEWLETKLTPLAEEVELKANLARAKEALKAHKAKKAAIK